MALICAKGVFSKEEILGRLNKEIENRKKYNVQYWPIYNLENEDLIGCCGLRPNERFDYEIGFHLRKEYWGKGYAKEAAQAVLDYAFECLNAKGIFAGHNPKNQHSKIVLEKHVFELSVKSFMNQPVYIIIRM